MERRYYVEYGVYMGKNKTPQIRTEQFYRMSDLIVCVKHLRRCSGVMGIEFGRRADVGAIGEYS